MDLFYYGSQDVPLPLGGDGVSPSRPRPRSEPAVCESCSAPVTVDDLEKGRATEEFGLVLCERCRLRARAEERVELYFCDRCQVSVPVFRVDTGEALAGDGRILCLLCREREQATGPPLWLLAPAFLLLLAVSVALIPERESSVVRHIPPEPSAVVLSEDLRREIQGLSRIAELDAVGTGLRRVLADLDDASRSRAEAMSSVTKMNLLFLGLKQDFESRVDLIREEARALRRDIDRLADRPEPED